MPVKPTEFCIGETRQRRTFVRQGRLSRHKVTVGEPAVGSPPKIFIIILKLEYKLTLAYNLFFERANIYKSKLRRGFIQWALSLVAKRPACTGGSRVRFTEGPFRSEVAP